MKKCPFCAEEIQDDAIKCKHCGEFLDGSRPQVREPQKTSWFFKPGSLILSFLVTGPFMLPLVWFHPNFSLTKKIIITIIVLVVTWQLTVVTGHFLGKIGDYYKTLGIY